MPDHQHVSTGDEVVGDAAIPISEHAPPDENRMLSDSIVASRPAQHAVPLPRGLARFRLQQVLAGAIERPITLVIAGAGMGKTEALARLCRDAAGVEPVWYALNADDVEPTTLLMRLF